MAQYNFDPIYNRVLALEHISVEQGAELFRKAPLSELMLLGWEVRQKIHPGNEVTWMIDRNVNITNVCISGCKFCNFHRSIHEEGTYTTTLEQYIEKIEGMRLLGGNQLLLQGGMHPKYGLAFYIDLFRQLKSRYPDVRLHALGPPEIVHIARKERISYKEVLEKLVSAGLDSLPGAGAEILCDRVRKELSPGKASVSEWLEVMRVAHEMGLVTSATMMFGHIETLEERLEHMVKIRNLQEAKPIGGDGFTAFIPWPVMTSGTPLAEQYNPSPVLPMEYVKMIAISRIMIINVPNIQASWLTVGKETAQISLHAGANDLGSIMIEENVVSSAGASWKFSAEDMQKTIYDAGFVAVLRDQSYKRIKFPPQVKKYPEN